MKSTEPEHPCVSYTDEIAVDLPHRDLVLRQLNSIDANCCIPPEPGDSNKVLNLGLIKLRAAGATAAKVMEQDWARRIPIRPPLADSADESLSDLDKIIDGVRLAIGAKYAGWYPRMGKVRNTDVVGGLPHTGAGTVYPESVGSSTGDVSGKSPFQLRSAASAEGRDVVVGMIDSAMFPHPDLDGRWYAAFGYPASSDDPAPHPWLRGHATFVAGRILDRAPGARLEVRGVLTGDVPKATVWDVAVAMADASEHGITLLNLSLGCFTADGQPPFVLSRAVDVLSARGAVLVAAGGNHGEGRGPVAANVPIFPAACSGVIAVGALENTDRYTPASSNPRGPWLTLGAPGVDVMSTYLQGKVEFSQLAGLPEPPKASEFSGYATWSGSSFATAAVSGEIARLMTQSGATAQEIVDELREVDPIENKGIGRYPS